MVIAVKRSLHILVKFLVENIMSYEPYDTAWWIRVYMCLFNPTSVENVHITRTHYSYTLLVHIIRTYNFLYSAHILQTLHIYQIPVSLCIEFN